MPRLGPSNDQTYANILRRAAEIVGGVDKLCERIGATQAECEAWLVGNVVPPRKVFLKVVDVLIEHVSGKSPKK